MSADLVSLDDRRRDVVELALVQADIKEAEIVPDPAPEEPTPAGPSAGTVPVGSQTSWPRSTCKGSS